MREHLHHDLRQRPFPIRRHRCGGCTLSCDERGPAGRSSSTICRWAPRPTLPSGNKAGGPRNQCRTPAARRRHERSAVETLIYLECTCRTIHSRYMYLIIACHRHTVHARNHLKPTVTSRVFRAHAFPKPHLKTKTSLVIIHVVTIHNYHGLVLCTIHANAMRVYNTLKRPDVKTSKVPTTNQ